MFEVNANTGFSTSEIATNANITDEVLIPPPELLPPKKEVSDRGSGLLPPNSEFEPTLVVYYDTNFAAKFSNPVAKYISPERSSLY